MKKISGVHIDGQSVATGRSIPSYDPSTGAPWVEVEVGGEAELDEAIRAARRAQRERWAPLAPWQRATVLRKFADLVEANHREIAATESLNNGKSIRDTREEALRGAEWLRFFAGAASALYGDTVALEAGMEAMIRREPVGVVGAITPWSSPVYLYMWKLAPALAGGNAVVLKPSEVAPATSLMIARYAEEAGVPPGVINIVTGEGSTVGAALASHRGIDKLTFTGGVAGGQAVAQLAAKNFTPTTIEAGGKTALIVLDDADLDTALNIAVRGGFRSAGQSCAHISRVLVQKSIYADFVGRFAEAVRGLKVGAAVDEDTFLGPVISARSVERCEGFVADSVADGGKVLAGGRRTKVDGSPGGHFFSPTVIEGVPDTARLMQEEVFGPIAAIRAFSTDDEALEVANGVDFGLVGAIMTRSLGRYRRFVRDLDVGVICVNAFRPGHWLLPYGGRKLSGMGIDNGFDVLREYTRPKTVVLGNIA